MYWFYFIWMWFSDVLFCCNHLPQNISRDKLINSDWFYVISWCVILWRSFAIDSIWFYTIFKALFCVIVLTHNFFRDFKSVLTQFVLIFVLTDLISFDFIWFPDVLFCGIRLPQNVSRESDKLSDSFWFDLIFLCVILRH